MEPEGPDVFAEPLVGGDRPDLCAAFADRIVAALGSMGGASRVTVLLTAHSLPKAVVAAGAREAPDLRTGSSGEFPDRSRPSLAAAFD